MSCAAQHHFRRKSVSRGAEPSDQGVGLDCDWTMGNMDLGAYLTYLRKPDESAKLDAFGLVMPGTCSRGRGAPSREHILDCGQPMQETRSGEWYEQSCPNNCAIATLRSPPLPLRMGHHHRRNLRANFRVWGPPHML
eukprot:1189239-Pyramimonas_sp.AAC.2